MNAISLFSGVGGFEIGFDRCGIDTVLQAERDRWCLEVLARHWPGTERIFDVHDLTTDVAYGAAMKYQPPRKLTPEQIIEAVQRYEAGQSLAPIASDMGVSRQAMWDLLRRRTDMRPQARFGAENNFFREGSRARKEAHRILERAVAAGTVTRPDQCEECGGATAFKDERAGIDAHHDDYSKPLEVRWLCRKCHHAAHRMRKEVPSEAPSIDLIYGGFP